MSNQLNRVNLNMLGQDVHNSIAQKVSSVNGVTPDANGDAAISLTALDDNSTHRTVTDDLIATWNAKGNGTVTSVNNIFPDANGNVTIPLLTSTSLSGASANRPIDPEVGTPYFDTTLSKPLWYKGLGNWVDSTGTVVAPPADTTPPTAITALTIGTITATSIVLNWTNSSSGDVANYEVAYSLDSGATYTVASNTITSAGATYTVSPLTASTAYTFRVVAIDGAGNRSTAVTVTGTTISGSSTPNAIVSDDFNRADSTTSAGTTDNYNGTGAGKAWTTFGNGGLGISNNQLYAPISGTGGNTAGSGYVDAGVADGRLEVVVSTLGNQHDFYFRANAGKYYRYSFNTAGWFLTENSSSGFVTIAQFTATNIKSGDLVAVEVQGSTSKLYLNGTLLRTDTLADLLTNTGFGLGFSAGPGVPSGAFENFNVYPVTSSSTGGSTGGGSTTPTPPSGGTITPKPTSYLSVTDYGAPGIGTADVTTYIQNCINAASSQGKAVVIPSGTYWINAVTALKIPSNMTIWFDNGATIKALSSTANSYQMLRIWSASNVNIIGYPTLVGDKQSRATFSGGEHGIGISICNSSNVNIENANVSYCWGDGVYLGDNQIGNPYNQNVTIKNSTFDNNTRQGMSVISAIGLTCDNCKFTNTYGTAPGAGIDFEPNQSNQYLQNIVITNSTITGNQGHGVWGYFGLGPTTSAPVSITVDNCTITGNSNTWYGDKTKQATVDMTVLGPYKGFVKFNGTYLMNK